ncbi:hypothetical protein C8R47DRAFT_1320677 [Mycena vitilis]|nr:hypothetical protein C8R47DRAFT_1320677 [Mycena vitilis]
MRKRRNEGKIDAAGAVSPFAAGRIHGLDAHRTKRDLKFFSTRRPDARAKATRNAENAAVVLSAQPDVRSRAHECSMTSEREAPTALPAFGTPTKSTTGSSSQRRRPDATRERFPAPLRGAEAPPDLTPNRPVIGTSSRDGGGVCGRKEGWKNGALCSRGDAHSERRSARPSLVLRPHVHPTTRKDSALMRRAVTCPAGDLLLIILGRAHSNERAPADSRPVMRGQSARSARSRGGSDTHRAWRPLCLPAPGCQRTRERGSAGIGRGKRLGTNTRTRQCAVATPTASEDSIRLPSLALAVLLRLHEDGGTGGRGRRLERGAHAPHTASGPCAEIPRVQIVLARTHIRTARRLAKEVVAPGGEAHIKLLRAREKDVATAGRGGADAPSFDPSSTGSAALLLHPGWEAMHDAVREDGANDPCSTDGQARERRTSYPRAKAAETPFTGARNRARGDSKQVPGVSVRGGRGGREAEEQRGAKGRGTSGGKRAIPSHSRAADSLPPPRAS